MPDIVNVFCYYDGNVQIYPIIVDCIVNIFNSVCLFFSTIRFVSCFAMTVAVTPAVAMEAAPMAVPISMGPDTKNLFGLEIAVPLVCFKNSVVKPSKIDVISGNFLVASSFGVHSRP